MEKGQSEVTNKIRSAIKQKLSEISDFVDDELPEYIMILVANQRSKSQIEKDLSLFLRNDTANFTNWLWDLLNNLKVGAKNIQSSVSKTDLDVLKKETDADEDAVVLNFAPDEHETDFLSHEDTNDSFISNPFSVKLNEAKKESVVTKSNQNYKPVEKTRIEFSSSVKPLKKVASSKELLSSAVVPVKRKLTDSEDEYDPAKPEYEKPSYSPKIRKYGGPAALQANKLLLKAVDDATKSILDGKNIEDYYKPTPIKVLTSKTCINFSPQREGNLQKKGLFQQIISQPELNHEMSSPEVSELGPKEYSTDVVMTDDTDYPLSSQRNRTICLKPVPLVTDSFEFENSEHIPESNYPYSFPAVEETRPKSPHFIVTLDGVSRTTFKRKFEENSVDSIEDDEEEEEEGEDTDKNLTDKGFTIPEKKQKLNERCKYWPACKNSDQCLYHHPTVPCKCFPDCKFGDKCLYIHPNCKFDALCSRKDCPFTHASKRKLPPIIAVPLKMIPVKSRRMKVVCKFYPKCASKNCPFIHPTLCRYGTECRLPACMYGHFPVPSCRYGTECRLPTCIYGHFPVPSRSQMKWQATIS